MLQNLQIFETQGSDSIVSKFLEELPEAIDEFLLNGLAGDHTNLNAVRGLDNCKCCCCVSKRKKANVANYRPISPTCVACTLMKHILVSGLMNHMKRSNLVFPWRASEQGDLNLAI